MSVASLRSTASQFHYSEPYSPIVSPLHTVILKVLSPIKIRQDGSIGCRDNYIRKLSSNSTPLQLALNSPIRRPAILGEERRQNGAHQKKLERVSYAHREVA